MKRKCNALIASVVIVLSLLVAGSAVAQQQTSVTGTVLAEDTGQPLSGVVITVGQDSTFSDENGRYTIGVAPGTYTIKALADGYQEWVQELSLTAAPVELNIKLISGEVIVIVDVGSRTQRTQLETPVPVDVISADAMNESGHGEVNQALATVAPSYNATHQTISDGTDHIDPASLRGLGPDQTLVLVNGKRRHHSALVNVNGTFGRGTVGTDLNAIPTGAIKRVEVLRDGASAQYGSDAIAGVVNIVLKDYADVVEFAARTGITGSGDGEELKAGLNWGYKLGDAGFVNVTAEFLDRGSTNRTDPWSGKIFPGIDDPAATDAELARRGQTREDYTMQIGQSAARVGMLYVNAAYPLTGDIEAYGFGGLTRRKGYASGFYRLPYQTERVDLTLYPDGFLPEINPLLHDWSAAGGVRGTLSGLKWDVSATHGGNSFHFFVDNSMNASLGALSPTSFDAGRMQFTQTSFNADLVKPIELAAVESMALVFGGETRFENYQIIAGEPASYVLGPETYIDDAGVEQPKTPGAQVFPGYQPDNEVDEWRNSQSAYVGVESKLTPKYLVDAAGRFEHYSDFGNALNFKVAGRAELVESVALRAAVSTGFRAPSVPQIYYNSISTQFVDVMQPDGSTALEPRQVLTANNISEVAEAFGIPRLNEETSINMSAGVTASPLKNVSFTADYYRIGIDGRVVLSNHFTTGDPIVADLLAPFPDVSRAQFFLNSVDTTTQGLDLVATYRTTAGPGRLDMSASANFTKTTVDAVNIPQSVADKFAGGDLDAIRTTIFNREEQNRLEDALPHQKGTLTAKYNLDKLSLRGRMNYYGSAKYRPTNEELNEDFGAKVLFDADVGYRVGKWGVSIGAINLLNTFPDKQQNPANVSDGRFVYSRRVSQFGINGGFYYIRLQYTN